MAGIEHEFSEGQQQNTSASVAWFYGRYSNAELQNDDSIAQQLLACRNDAAKKGQTIPQEWVFADPGVLGSEADRPELNRLLDLVRTKSAKCTDLYIFDTSRLSRDLEFASGKQKFFDFHQVRVHYVANGMISGKPGFVLQHALFSAVDQQFSRTLGEHVKRGHRHKFESGYYAGARTYGYLHVPDIDPAFADSYNKRRRRGVWVEVDPVESEVVRMIFRLYRIGMGYDAIARYLNEQGIKSPRKPTKNTTRCWSTSSVRTILTNERYLGIVRLGVTETLRDPETKKVVHRKRDESEWSTYRSEALRIVSDEDFYAVSEVRASRDTLKSQRKTGGLNKAQGIYIWSGLLRCGVCGGTISVCQPDTYMCTTAYRKGGCCNKTKLKRSVLERDLFEVLVRMVREARSFDSMVEAVMQEIRKLQAEAEKAAKSAEANRGSVETKLSTINTEITRLVSSMIMHGPSEALSAALREREAHRLVLIQQLDNTRKSDANYFSREQVAKFLSEGFSHMADILLDDAKTSREEIRKRVDHLILTPITVANSPAYEVSGDLRLFDDEKIKMLGCNGSITAKHLGLCLSLTGLTLKLEPNGKILHIAQPTRHSTSKSAEVSAAA